MHETALDRVAAAVAAYRYHFAGEAELQAGIARALAAEGVAAEREHSLGRLGRIDFYVPEGRIGIEVKIAGGANDVLRQVHGYLQHADVAAVILATTRVTHRDLPEELAGKPLRVVYLGGL